MKDSGWYCWLAATAIFVSMFVIGLSTFGSISVMTYICIEKFNLSTEIAAWVAAVLHASIFFTGEAVT